MVRVKGALTWMLASASMTTAAVAADIPVYDATQVAFDGYTIVKRIPAEDWRSAFWIGGHADEAGARRAVLDQAARAGADAVVNLTCMSRTDGLVKGAGHYCYGDAIKAKPRAR